MHVLLRLATYILKLSSLGILAAGQRIFADTIGLATLDVGTPIVRFIARVMGTIGSYLGFVRFAGPGTPYNLAKQAEMQGV